MCDELDGPSAFQEQMRKARKEHHCAACSEVIRVNDYYSYCSGIWDGTPSSYHHCLRCHAMIQGIMAVTHDPVDLELACGNDWEDVFDDPPPEHMVRLAFMTADEAQKELRP